jgi:ATP-dependent DNA helicase RecG
LEKYLSLGNQIYIVYPLIEKSESINALSIEEHIDIIKRRFKDFSLAVIHGKINSYEKDAIMRKFREGKIDILIATTVIETGIDVPTATIMVIENADRFGLSQLHQLRGRVGRGDKQSFCVLIATEKASKKAIARLKVIEKYQDGFKIADEDMKMRGPGDILGNKQTGMPEFKFADIREDSDIWRIARIESKNYIQKHSLSDDFLRLLLKQIRDEKGFLYIS